MPLGPVARAPAIAAPADGTTRDQASVVEYHDFSGNGIYDTASYDGDVDGFVEILWRDANEDGSWEARAEDSNEDSRLDALWATRNPDGYYEIYLGYGYQGVGPQASTAILWLDDDANGVWEFGAFDGDNNGWFEWVTVDTNGDGAADAWGNNSAVGGFWDVRAEAARWVATAIAASLPGAFGYSVP